MNEKMLAARRSIGARAILTLPTGAELALEGGDILSFGVEEGADSALLPGAVLSAKLSLTVSNENGVRRDLPLVGATAQMFVLCEGEALPCGVFVIDSVSAKEGSGAVTLSGSDSIASELSGRFEDTLSYPTTLAQLWAHLVSQTRYAWSGEMPGGSAAVSEKPNWGEATLRRAAGWIAQAAGCFVRVGRTGGLELVPCKAQDGQALGPDAYLSLDDGFEAFGPVSGVRVVMPDDSAFTAGDGAGEILTVEKNPLAGEAMARNMLAQLKDLRLERASFRWRGDPSVGVGSRIALTDTAGRVKICTVTRQTMRFEKGFSAECVCSVPDSGSGGVVRAITPEGGVNAGALVGTVDGGLLRAGSVLAKSIAAGTITAEKLAAGSVTADKLDADSVSARTAQFVAAEIEKLTADDVSANRLYAAVAHVVSLAAGNVTAGSVQADRLSAALADFVSAYAKVGRFDFAAAQNIVSGAMSLQQGSMDTVYIRNLAVTGANLLSATLGKLILKGDDGKYWRVFIGSDGMISAQVLADADEMIAAGGQVVETGLNVGALNAENLQAASAAVNRILTSALTAGSITAADALIASATVPELYTTGIRAIGEALELENSRKSAVYRGELPPDDVQEGDLWVQPSTGFIYQMADSEAGKPEFFMDEGGTAYFRYAEGLPVYPLSVDEQGNLLIAADAPWQLTISSDGRLTAWQRVKDGELDAAARAAIERANAAADRAEDNAALLTEHSSKLTLLENAVSARVSQEAFEENAEGLKESIASAYSQLTQRADSVELEMGRKIDGEELRSYIRYENGNVELGSSDSRYITRTSDSGFAVLQDGAVMAEMVRNSISAPVLSAQRQLALGNFSLRLGANGHLLLV